MKNNVNDAFRNTTFFPDILIVMLVGVICTVIFVNMVVYLFHLERPSPDEQSTVRIARNTDNTYRVEKFIQTPSWRVVSGLDQVSEEALTKLLSALSLGFNIDISEDTFPEVKAELIDKKYKQTVSLNSHINHE